MSVEIISALIGAFSLIIAEFIGFVLYQIQNRKKKSHRDMACVTFLSTNYSFDKLLERTNSLMMYSVNSHILVNQLITLLERNTSLQLANVTLLVRKKQDETPKDLEILNTNIELWKNMVKKGRIKNLHIIGYDHDPDHYYTIIGDKLVFCGQVFFDSNMPTDTKVNHSPIVFYDDTKTGRAIIKNYQSHFDNLVKHYKKKFTLYSTDTLD